MFRLTLLLAICLGAFLTACDTSSTAQSPNPFAYENYTDLTQVLRQQFGVEVRGSGANAMVFVRGGNTTIKGSSEVLFVLNKTTLGKGYANIRGSVTPQDISTIKVLRGLSATNKYGELGSNGVIEVYTKSYKGRI